MNSFYQIKKNYHIEILDPKRVVLFTEDTHFLLTGELYVQIVRILQKEKTQKRNIIALLENAFLSTHIEHALERLLSKNFIQECKPSQENDAYSAFWSYLTIKHDVIPNIKVVNYSRHLDKDIIDIVENAGITTKEDCDLYLVVVENYISKELELFNLNRIKDQKPWILLKPSGHIAWIGPIFYPKKTACWNCLCKKLKENRRVEVDIFGVNNEKLNILSLPSLPTTINISISLATNEIIKWFKNPENTNFYNNIFTLDFRNLESQFHHFVRSSLCSICNPNFEKNSDLPRLKSCEKKYCDTDDERSSSPEETFVTLKNFVSPLTGIVSQLKYSMINEKHICYAVRNLPLTKQNNISKVGFRVPDTVVGKGDTKLKASVGCLAEAIERYSNAFSWQSEIRCSYEFIKEKALHPNTLLNFSQTQYKNRDKINFNRYGFNKVPKPYDNNKIGWTLISSLMDNKKYYVPSSYCYISYPFEEDIEICPGNSNGCASGNTIEEAIFYALLELIERDAVALWWYNRIARPCIDLKILKDEKIYRFESYLKNQDRKFYVLDITTDLEIPCYVAVSSKNDGNEIFFGSSTHLDPNIAIRKAINELTQIMIKSNTRDISIESIPNHEKELMQWLTNENIENHNHLSPNGVTTNLMPNFSTDDFINDITFCLKKFEKNELDVLFLNLTHPDLHFPTVRLISPGLRHFWSRLGSGRLYEVPVKMKWLEKQLDETQMNPISYFL